MVYGLLARVESSLTGVEVAKLVLLAFAHVMEVVINDDRVSQFWIQDFGSAGVMVGWCYDVWYFARW